MKKIIFRFNRTLYDPGRGKLVPTAVHVLYTLRRRGYELYLVTQADDGRRELLGKLGIKKFFTQVMIVERNTVKSFRALAGEEPAAVVGDHIGEEIDIGNRLGLTTVWIRKDKFADQTPRPPDKTPTHTVSRLRDVLLVLP